MTRVSPVFRIRGLLLLNLQPEDGLHQIEHAPPLGSRADVIGAVRAAAPGIQFDEAGRGRLGGRDEYISIEVGRDDLVYTAVASAEGVNGLEMFRALLQHTRWRAYAPRAGVFIEPDTLELHAMADVVRV